MKTLILDQALKELGNNLRSFINLSLFEDEKSWAEWISSAAQHLEIRCWEKKRCDETNCPAYENECGRCWLIAGTMCGGKVRGKFAQKYATCCECEVYQEAVFHSPITEMQEHVITLVHALRSKQFELKELALKDSLTGLYNRRYFDMTINREIERSRRTGDNLAVMMIDVDRLKYVNDVYGHLQGDYILRECASLLDKSARASDLLVRFGGDEFLVVMARTSCKDTDFFIDRINENISEWNTRNGKDDYQLSLSIGCAELNPDMDVQEMIRRADHRMYEAKVVSR